MTVLDWFCTRHVWILSPRYPSLICLCGLSEEGLYSSLTLSTSRATSIFSCIWRIGEKRALVFLAIKRVFHTFNKLCFVLSAVVEVERERKRRNLIPARLGIYAIWVFAFHQICEQFAYNAFRRSKVNTRQQHEVLGSYYPSLNAIRISCRRHLD